MMLAQTAGDFGEVGPAIAWLGALALAFGPGAMGITKIVDFLRDAFDKQDTLPRFTWIVAAFVIALAICLGFEVNIVGGFFKELPAFANSTALDGCGGQMLTAFGLAGAASYWHERMDLASSTAKAADTVVIDDTTTTSTFE